jgi:hypothetical protein
MAADRFRALHAVALALVSACARQTLPDPAPAVRAYADAARRGDAKRIYAMLSERSRRDLRPEDVDRLVAEQRRELVAQAAAVTGPYVAVRASATVRYPDGETATLDIENGRFRVGAAEGLPSLSRTPQQALEQLRKALAHRSYPVLLRALSPAVGSAIESDLRALVEGLTRPEELDVQVTGDTALVRIEGGHSVRLRREAGVWRVEDFE